MAHEATAWFAEWTGSLLFSSVLRKGAGALAWLAVIGLALPLPAADYARDVQPLLHEKCAACHSGAQPEGRLSVNSWQHLLRGGDSGPAVVAGSSASSLLVQRVSAKSPTTPLAHPSLSPEEIAVLASWIDAGAERASVSEPQPVAALDLRRPAVPGEAGLHPIDALMAVYFRRHGVEQQAHVSDAVFARRAYFDLWGLPPTSEQLHVFLQAHGGDKRERLIESLLAHGKNYSEHWISFWNDLLRNDAGVTYPGGTRESITEWLLAALENNLPYDRMTRSLLNPVEKGAPKGFLIGVHWGGDDSASQSPPLQAAQNSAQIFLGENLKCAACHDSFVSRWKLRDTYGLASFFSEGPLEIFRCDVPTGENSAARFLFPDITTEQPPDSLEGRRALAAQLFTAPENGRFARTFVNRIWRRLFGRGLVEPVDEMENRPWDADLLDWLAADFVDHQYDVQHLLRRIMTSRAYQLPAVRQTSQTENEYVFQGPLYRRLSAEPFLDAVSSVTGEWRILASEQAGPGAYAREWRFKLSTLSRALGRPDRDRVNSVRQAEPTTLQVLELINGETFAALLRRGAQRLTNVLPPAPASLFDSGVVTDGNVKIDIDVTAVEQLRLLVEDAGSYDRAKVVAGWAGAEFTGEGGMTRLNDLGAQADARNDVIRMKGGEPTEALLVGAPSELVYDIAGKGYQRLRAVVGVDEGSLLYQITPKVRFFVFSEEPDRDQLVGVTGEPPVPWPARAQNKDALIDSVYRHALSRDPTAGERRVAHEFLKEPGSAGLEDLLWGVFLSPEFQFVR